MKLNKELSVLFDTAIVSKVTLNNQGDLLKVCLYSDHIIPYSAIKKATAAIKDVLFKNKNIAVKLLQKYSLPKSYNLRVLMDVYKDSLQAELDDRDHRLSAAFRKADFTFSNDSTMNIVLPDTTGNHLKEKELIELLEKIFTERCGVDAILSVSYKPKETVERNADEAMISRRIAAIAANAGILTNYSSETEENVGADIDGAVSAEGAGSRAEEGGMQASMSSQAAGSATGAGGVNGTGTGSDAGGTGSAGNAGNRTTGSRTQSKTYGRKGAGNNFDRDNRRALVRSDNPNVIYGKDVDGEIIPMKDIVGEIGEVVVHGMVVATEERQIRNEKTIYFFDVTDFTDTFHLKVFVHNDQVKELSGKLKQGAFVKLKGVAMMDDFEHELTIGSIQGIQSIKDFRTPREDLAEEKRVELHCHTKMSDMDGVSDVSAIVKRAYKWGHRAIAITDHGVVQSFPEANHVWDDLWGAEKKRRIENGDANPNPDDFFKVIYGVEAYLVDDLKKCVGTEGDETPIDSTCVVFDLETTGLSAVSDRIIEFGAVKIKDGAIVDRFSAFVNPGFPIPFRITQLTSITDDMVMDADPIETVLPKFLDFVSGSYLVAHNAEFDTSFVRKNCERLGLTYDFNHVDTLMLSKVLLPHLAKYTLDSVAKDLGVSLLNHHRAVDDAECTANIYIKLCEMLKVREICNLAGVGNLKMDTAEFVKKNRSHHAIILAKNNVGRVNLYKLVSMSHLFYMRRGKPCVPKSLLMEHRKGLILGSACEAGELYDELLHGANEAEIARLVDFYDYLEIQPVGNNMFMILSDKHENINSVEDIQDVNRKIVELGERFNKPVVATCDVHFLDPEDEIYRRILMAGEGFKDADNQAPLYLHTTEEMLKEFSYLGYEKAKEIVIKNPNRIADMCDKISPVRPDKCPPVIEDSDKLLRDICYNKAHDMYGDPLPEIVLERLERELKSIIGNGFAVMYIIAQKLVWKSVEDGYLVGSRGSVGSSFVATMAGITEVNPLSPHYYCGKCHYSDFESPEVRAYAGRAGVDMPDKVCPICGEKLIKDGFDIPFETFLGFKGDKEPDIDLNFSSEYQSKAHKYVEVIFGAEQAFRAGTIGTLADKTAYGFVKKYYEERDVRKRPCEINRILQGCVGVRRSTGQHPGGIIVLPVGEEIDSFTPVQHPPKDENTITTHFDYHSIDHNLLKLDILGHEDPTMIRKLQDLTGRDPLTIPLDDPGVMSLFKNTDALGITPDDIGGTPLGCLGIPEFGTDFAMNMLIDTKPQAFSDLVRIAGLAHGTNVWQGNAEVLIKEGKATISTAICTRDDIMVYLIEMGVESSHAFSIMENVRKGKVAKGKCSQWPEWKQEMLDHNVPDWYIWSCEHIEYMFPKAHAAAYVMMAWRVAYCKINYPLEFYAAFFSIRAKAFSYEAMCLGRDHLEQSMAECKKRLADKSTATKKDEAMLKDMRLVQEMYARGYEFLPIDIFRVSARSFQVIDGKIMPSLTSIEGLGENAADQMVEGVKGGPFLSKQDFRERTHASSTIVDKMAELGLLGDLPETNQISIFDYMGQV